MSRLTAAVLGGVLVVTTSCSSTPEPSLDSRPIEIDDDTATETSVDDTVDDAVGDTVDDPAADSDESESDPDETDDDAAPEATSTDGSTSIDTAAPEACSTLAQAGYETRRAAVASVADQTGADEPDVLTALATECADDVDRLVAARDIEARATALGSDPDPVAITDVRCSRGEYSFIVENTAEDTIGVHIAFRIFEADSDVPRSSADYPIVIWQLEPGGKQGITGEFQEPPTTDYRCNLSARVFVSDTSSAGAGIPGVAEPDRLGDDPVEWFGSLLEAETLAIGSDDPDRASNTEDLRSLFYDDVLDAVTGDEATTRIPTAVRICTGTVDQPDPDRMSFVYSITYDSDGVEETFSRHGLFRRGSDGMWRWLSAAQYFESTVFGDCS